ARRPPMRPIGAAVCWAIWMPAASFRPFTPILRLALSALPTQLPRLRQTRLLTAPRDRLQLETRLCHHRASS
ncbi:hypothetical protein LPJ57_010629, partial [Coemansia sp. RSA 486]